jgi:hypothetical protein
MRFINLLLGAIAALLAAAALGAIWSLIGLAGSARASWVAPIAALVLAAVLRFNNHPAGAIRAAFCVILVALTIAHANFLMAAGFIAGQMGLGLLDALHLIGLDMAYAVSRAQTSSSDAMFYVLALALGLVFGFRQPRETSKPKPAPRRR